MKPGRMMCCVPHCNRSCKIGLWAEWICGKHWRLVGKITRRRFFMARRRRLRDSENYLWRRCKRQAIERAGGIG